MIWTYFFAPLVMLSGCVSERNWTLSLPEDTQLGTVVVEMGTKQSRLRQCYAAYY